VESQQGKVSMFVIFIIAVIICGLAAIIINLLVNRLCNWLWWLFVEAMIEYQSQQKSPRRG
jgi:Na+/alanine symporter